MGKLVVVKGDPVTGTDLHTVSGTTAQGSAYAGTGKFAYNGSVTAEPSDFVSIGGTPVALVTSGSSLGPAETATGGHGPLSGKDFSAPGPAPNSPVSLLDTPLGAGAPSSGAGSGLLTVDGVGVLLDGDSFDTCGPAPTTAASSVAAQGQDFVTCAE
ncbi:hypothetical protein ABZ342_25715 [Amycolatopsis sp. NPDC005961]|uniref:hypothetical protein n=1 Tax=Amycolatopsis sp. NPDC005961 TaxID=3156720 RepID=UPI0033E89077